MVYEQKYPPGPDDCEDLEKYESGGLHPVELNDSFESGRYVVLHKLGHGGSCTVWLAYDHQEAKCVALKLLSSTGSKSTNEVKIQHHLRSMTTLSNGIGAKICHEFTFQGPNGQHKGLVQELLGPSLSSFTETFMVKLKPATGRNVACQVASALGDLHRNGIVVGDISAGNILFKLETKDLSAENIYDEFGRPDGYPFEALEGAEVAPGSAPTKQYSPISYGQDALRLVMPSIVLIDLNEVTLPHGTSDSQTKNKDSDGCDDDDDDEVCAAANPMYAAPEWHLGITCQHTRASDIWSLGCIFFEIRTSGPLFGDDVLADANRMLGKPPSAREDIICIRNEAYLETSFWSDGEAGEDPIEDKLQSVGNWPKWHRLTTEEKRNTLLRNIQDGLEDPNCPHYSFTIDDAVNTIPPHAKLSQQELADFGDLLGRMLRWLPEERTTIEEVLAHPWLNTTYEDLDPPCPDICHYDPGWAHPVYTEEERERQKQWDANWERYIEEKTLQNAVAVTADEKAGDLPPDQIQNPFDSGSGTSEV